MIKTETVVGVFDTDKGLTSVATPSGVGQTYLMSYNPTTQTITDPAQRAAVGEVAGGSLATEADFASGRYLYKGAPYTLSDWLKKNGATFTRAGRAWAVTRAGRVSLYKQNEPRTAEDGLYLSGAASGVLSNPMEFDASAWNSSATNFVPNSLVAPDGNKTAYLFKGGTMARQYFSYLANTKYTTIYVAKYDSWRYMAVCPADAYSSGNNRAFADLSTGQCTIITPYKGSIQEFYSVDLGNGWRAYVLKYTTATAPSNFCDVMFCDSTGLRSDGDGSRTAGLWYVQSFAGDSLEFPLSGAYGSPTKPAETLTLQPSFQCDALVTYGDGTSKMLVRADAGVTVPAHSDPRVPVTKIQLVTRPASSANADAVAVGVTNRVFFDDFDSISTIDTTGSLSPSKNWFLQKWFGGGNTSASEISVSNSVLKIGSGGATGQNWVMSAIAASGGGYIGNVFGAGKATYYEARMRHDADSSTSASTAFPAFWSIAIEHIMGLEQWPGQAAGYGHFAELDFVEVMRQAGKSATYNTYVTCTIHDWSGIYSSGWPYDIANGKNGATDNNRIYLPAAVESEWHTYGCLYVPKKGSDPGYVSWYIDDVKVNTIYFSGPPTAPPLDNQGTTNSFSPTTPAAATQTYSIIDQQRMAICLQGDKSWPVYFDYVAVWQAP